VAKLWCKTYLRPIYFQKLDRDLSGQSRSKLKSPLPLVSIFIDDKCRNKCLNYGNFKVQKSNYGKVKVKQVF
jgi:hypothetical protein